MQASILLLASSVSLTARQWHFNHTGGEGDPQSMTLAVYLHANDAFVLHPIYTAPRRGREEEREEDTTWIIPRILFFTYNVYRKGTQEATK